MHKEKFSFSKVKSNSDWNYFLNGVTNKSLFSSCDYLNLIGDKYHTWFIKKGEEIKAGFYCSVSDDEKKIIENNFLIYSGFVFKNFNQTKDAKKNHQKFQIIEFIANSLPEIYDKINFSCSPDIIDVRPFQWFNYNSNRKKYEIDIRYTSYINVNNYDSSNEFNNTLFNNMDTVRRYSVREGIKDKFSILESDNSNKILEFYEKTLLNQGVDTQKRKLVIMENIITNLIALNKGKLFEIRDSLNKLLYCVFYAWDENKAYYLFGAGGEETKSWQTTIATWEIIKYFYSNKIPIIDLEGVNSPKRGWFKLSFGGKLIPYYRISI